MGGHMKYAKLEKGIVTELIEISDSDESLIWSGKLGHPNKWEKVETTAGIGWTYSNYTFTPPKPYDSWVLNKDGTTWDAPKAIPDGKAYKWNESKKDWEVV